MHYNLLGKTDLQVSKICLGTMTWGEQNTQNDAFRQMDYATAEGVNFFDTAYGMPSRPKLKHMEKQKSSSATG
jgi:aryl-alcohol dehydrogenase-like predicted oxidoreductase